MMEKFVLRKTNKGIIQAYRWPVPSPGRVVCIIHGIGEHGGRYDRVAGRFNEAGMEVFSMDLRGHGYSLGKRGDCSPRDEILEDINALISRAFRVHPGCRLILFGHSMGGNITLDYRRRGDYREMPAGYLISAPWIRLVRHIPEPIYHMVRVASGIAPKLTMGSAVKESELGNQDIVLPYHDDPMVHNRISLRCAVEGFEAGRLFESEAMARIAGERGEEKPDPLIRDIPTMIMHGGDDHICDINAAKTVYKGLKAAGENVAFREFPGLYHEIHNGGPESKCEEAIDAMINFFSSC